MSITAIESYYKSNLYKPFFVSVGDSEYRFIKEKLVESGDVEFVLLSKFCGNVDKKPNIDKLRETLRMADVDCDSNKIVLLGLGEYLALEGNEKASTILNELVSFNLGSAHAVFLLRGVAPQIQNMLNNDPRLNERQIVVGKDTTSSISFVFSSMELGMFSDNGFKRALELAEEGLQERICVNTSIEFSNSIYPVRRIKNPYEALCKKIKSFKIPKQLGTDTFWENLLKDINKYQTIEKVFESYSFDMSLDEFYERVSGSEYYNWLYFIFLITNTSKITNQYLKWVIDISADFEDFKFKILNAISDVKHTDTNFSILYKDRKKLVYHYPDSDIALFIANNRFDSDESIYKLTDNTLVEREEIISDIGQHGIPDELEKIYPALSLYLKKYCFHGDAINDLLTDYFDEYKQQKITNVLNSEFLAKVEELAISRDYNRLRTRDELISAISTESAYLCWIDALGVEYLSFIVEMAQRKGLAVSVNVGRSDLPTITGINKSFFDVWPNEQKHKEERLDEIKHKEKGGYKYSANNLYAIHLAKELQIISDVIDDASTTLGLRKFDKYIIASDHGASRLAVLRNKDEKYDTDTQGEHSGRCCKKFDNYDLPFATEDNGYVVLADYGRFKGSRAANVEVHGGASLEEVVVPVIALSLRDSSISIKMLENIVKADYKFGTTITLFVNKAISKTLSVEYKGKRYSAVKEDDNHYKVNISDIKRACTEPADVYLDEDLVSHISIKAVGKSASMNSDFDDLF